MFFQNISSRVCVQIFMAFCVNLCEVINGYGVAWSAPVLPKFDDPAQSPLPYSITEIQKSWIASVTFFGYIGAFSGGYLANLVGRKRAFIIGGITHVATYLLLTFSRSLVLMYIARFMVGTCICFLMAVETMYVGEMAFPNIRGIVMTSMGVSHAFGGLLVYCVGPFVDYKIVGYVSIALNVVFIIACCFLPESPMYYVLKDDEKSARTAILRVRKSVDANKELKAMIDKAQEQRNNKHIWRELFSLKSNRRSLFITMSLTIFQQGSGMMAVVFYANTIFKYAASSIQPDVATIIVGATFVVGALLAPIFIDKYGRRILLMVSSAGLFITMALLGVYFYYRQADPSSVMNIGWLPLLLLVLAQFSFSLGLSIVPNTLTSELFTPRVRGLGSPISICSGMVSGFVSTTLFSYIVIALGIHFTFWLFAIYNVLAFMFVIFFVPETMGKSLMEIQEMLEK